MYLCNVLYFRLAVRMSVSLSLSISLSVFLSACVCRSVSVRHPSSLSVCLSVRQPVCLSVSLSASLRIFLLVNSACQATNLSGSLSTCVSVLLFAILPVCPDWP